METQEWVTKAENDWRSLNREMSFPDDNNFDDACYHAQQCAEKYLKAFLIEASVRFDRVTHLPTLLDRTLDYSPNWSIFRPVLQVLGDFRDEFRYPGRTATRDIAENAREICAEVRAVIHPALGLSDNVDSE